MLQSKSFVKKTKKGKVLKVVREHYLRDDIYSGSPLDPECDPSSHKLSAEAPHYLIVDTNIALHQMDLLEHSAVTDAIITSIVLEEVKARNSSVYQRLRALISSDLKRFYVFANEHHRDTYITAEPGESPNDRNDRAIRVAASWYTSRIPGIQILLLTDDAMNRLKAKELGVTAISSTEYATMRSQDVPELIDLVAASKEADAILAKETESSSMKTQKDRHLSGGRASKRQRIYEDHASTSQITAGIASGRYHQGSLRVNRFNPFEGWVGSESIGEDILIQGRKAMNRAMDGDVVAIEILPEDQWSKPRSSLPGQLKKKKLGNKEQLHDGGDNDDDEELEEEELEDTEGAHIVQVDPGEHYHDESLIRTTTTTTTTTSSSSLAKTDENRRPTGKVIGIIKRNWRVRGYCGSIHLPSSSSKGGTIPSTDGTSCSLLFVPVEQKFPKIRFVTRQAATLSDKRFIVALDSWDNDSYYPQGHYVRTLGAIGDRDVETEVVLIENDINTAPFSPAVHACVPHLPWTVSENEIQDPSRIDLRHLPICSVDPPGCKDIDDALHVREMANGNLELGVHIADVTHFLKPGSAMDYEAALRGTTTYLVQRRIDMLPKPLTEDICSLRADVDRLSFSVLWELTPDTAEIVHTRITKSVIRSRAALTYQEAQTRIDDVRLTDELTENLRTMNRIAKVLRQKRIERGALSLASPEVKFEIDTATHDPLDVGMYQVRETNQMVEEMMLLANCTVAEYCLQHFPASSLLRRHPTPPPRQFDPLLRAAAAVNISIDPTTSKTLAHSLDLAVRPSDPYFNTLIRIMATRCMTQAVYFNSGEYSVPEYFHYGLAAPLYTHFTSPIRRYADVVVHRVLMASLQLESMPESMRDRDAMHDMVSNLNVRHRNAQMAGRASVELHTLIFFKERSVLADARVTRVKSNGLIVFIPKFGIEGLVFLDNSENHDNNDGPVDMDTTPVYADASLQKNKEKEENAFIFDEEKQIVKSVAGSLQYTIFDPCAVEIYVEEGNGRRRKLVLKLVPREMLPESEKMDA